MKLGVIDYIDCAHYLPGHDKCGSLHGHTYKIEVVIEGEKTSGMVIDFSDLKRVVESRVLERLDHACANDLMDNPTAEVLARWIWDELRPELPGLAEIELGETRDCSVVYRGGP